jgi:hypothetical protein
MRYSSMRKRRHVSIRAGRNVGHDEGAKQFGGQMVKYSCEHGDPTGYREILVGARQVAMLRGELPNGARIEDVLLCTECKRKHDESAERYRASQKPREDEEPD